MRFYQRRFNFNPGLKSHKILQSFKSYLYIIRDYNLQKIKTSVSFYKMALKVSLTISGLLLSVVLVLGSTPRERFRTRREQNNPILETYWESYTSFPYDYLTCLGHTDPQEVDLSDFGVDLSTIPVAKADVGQNGVNVVNIAFANPDFD